MCTSGNICRGVYSQASINKGKNMACCLLQLFMSLLGVWENRNEETGFGVTFMCMFASA